ncbi:MAG: FHA domain-containing serine/threonine-protein kinase [Rhodospirillaceae bacterium]
MMGLATGSDALPPGYQLNEYKIRAVLGRGGFGVSYVVEDVYLEHVVAIKEYYPIGLATRNGAQVTPVGEADQEKGRIFAWGLNRFIDEARILARCRHSNIIRVIRYFEGNGTAYLVMDFETGVELGVHRDRLERPFSEAELLALMAPLMDGLALVHNAGFLHRDIKPGNIMVRPDGTPVLLDFGAARQALGTYGGLFTVIVTNGYAPIEQYAADGDQGPWTDVYGLGAVFYWAVTGIKPPDALSRMRRDVYQPVSVLKRGLYSERLLAAIDGALMFDPADRFRSMDEWQEVLQGTRPIPPQLVEQLAAWPSAAPAPPAPTPPAPYIVQASSVPPAASAPLMTIAAHELTELELPAPASPHPSPNPHTDIASRAARPPTRVIAPRDLFAENTFRGWRKTVEGKPASGSSRPVLTARTATPPRTEPIIAQNLKVPPPQTAPPPAEPPSPPPSPPPLKSAEDSARPEAYGILTLRYKDAKITVPDDGKDFKIGRNDTNHLIINDAKVSRKHARIVYQDGHYVIADISKFGTWIKYADGHIVALNGTAEVLRGSGQIAFGDEPDSACSTATFRYLDGTDSVTLMDM